MVCGWVGSLQHEELYSRATTLGGLRASALDEHGDMLPKPYK